MDCISKKDMETLRDICPGAVLQNLDLSAISHWRIGGRAELILRPSSTAEVAELRSWFYKRGLPHIVIGKTTNVLFADEGLHVPCVQIGAGMSRLCIEHGEVYAEAGVWVPRMSRTLMLNGLTGGEHMCGIPGTLGGLICMNGGSNGRLIGDSVVSVESVDSRGSIIDRPAGECGFGYRRSVYQTNDEIVTSVRMRFLQGVCVAIRAEMLADLNNRRRKFPLKEPSCGSVFKSNPGIYADFGPPGAVIERLGFKGMRVGGAMVSPRHANFIVNTGQAKAADVLEIMKTIRDAVYAQTGYLLEAEACYVTPEGKIVPASSVL